MQKQPLENRYLQALRGSGDSAATGTAAYERDSAAYDPQASFERSAAGAYAGFKRNLSRDVRSLRGSLVGAGRIDTGFGTQDEDRLISDSSERFEGMLADRAMQAEGLRYSNLRDRGAYATNQQNTYLDLLSGGLDRAQAEENARRARRANRWRGLGAAIGGVGGFLIGGPAGATAGAQIGAGAGGFFE